MTQVERIYTDFKSGTETVESEESYEIWEEWRTHYGKLE